MAKIRVGVIRGGPSSEYGVSLKTGSEVLKYLSTDKYLPIDILIDRQGKWHWWGLPTTPDKIASRVDLVFNALHGEYGEDGEVQSILDDLGIPYSGSGRLASALGMNKAMAKNIFNREGIKTPRDVLLEANTDPVQAADFVFRQLPPPWIIKPVDRGSSVGVFLAQTFPDLIQALKQAILFSPRILVEEYIRGREATCGVVDKFRGHDIYSLPPIEIRRPIGKALFDYEAKYNGQTEEICPGYFNQEEKEEIERLASLSHKLLGLRHYSRSDFIISPRGVYLLEVNTLPGLTTNSLLPKSLSAIGCEYGQFLDHLISLSLNR